jgi:hypothetical protein
MPEADLPVVAALRAPRLQRLWRSHCGQVQAGPPLAENPFGSDREKAIPIGIGLYVEPKSVRLILSEE